MVVTVGTHPRAQEGSFVNKTVCVFGHSHVWSVRRAIAAPLVERVRFEAPICGTQEMPGPLLYWDGQKRPQLNAVLAALLNRLSPSPDLWLLSMVQGNHYNQLGMLTSGVPFDFVLPTAPDLPFDAEALNLPFMAVKAALEAQMAPMPTYLDRLRATEFAPQILIAGVSPPPHDSLIFKPMLEEKDLMPELSSPYVRLKLWRLQNEILEEACRARGLVYLSGDILGTQDEEGFLSPAYVKDAVHSNGEWAQMFLRSVADHIETRAERGDV